jgi:hypothetical protein
VSLGGADVAQIDDFYDDTIGVQAKKEVQEFSEVLNTCDERFQFWRELDVPHFDVNNYYLLLYLSYQSFDWYR